jgi:predicted MFS family arabinose efflux permease
MERIMTGASPLSMSRLYWLALGTFAIGTEGFMIAPLLPDLSRDLSVSIASAGQLVTVFAPDLRAQLPGPDGAYGRH